MVPRNINRGHHYRRDVHRFCGHKLQVTNCEAEKTKHRSEVLLTVRIHKALRVAGGPSATLAH